MSYHNLLSCVFFNLIIRTLFYVVFIVVMLHHTSLLHFIKFCKIKSVVDKLPQFGLRIPLPSCILAVVLSLLFNIKFLRFLYKKTLNLNVVHFSIVANVSPLFMP